MKKIAIAAVVAGVSALTMGVWAQNPGRPPEGGQPQPERMRAEMRERMMQHFQQRGRPAGGSGGGMQRPPMMPGHDGQGPDAGDVLQRVISNPEIAKKAGVTDEQIKKLKDGHFNFEKSMITMRADAEVAKMEVKRLAEADKVDRGALEKAIDVAGLKEVAVRKASLLRMLDVKETLGAEQIEKIKGMVREHMMQRMKQQGGEMPGTERPWLQQRGGAREGQQPPRDEKRPEGRGGERGNN